MESHHLGGANWESRHLGGADGGGTPSLPWGCGRRGYRLSISGSSMLRFRALKLMPTNVTGRLPPLYASA